MPEHKMQPGVGQDWLDYFWPGPTPPGFGSARLVDLKFDHLTFDGPVWELLGFDGGTMKSDYIMVEIHNGTVWYLKPYAEKPGLSGIGEGTITFDYFEMPRGHSWNDLKHLKYVNSMKVMAFIGWEKQHYWAKAQIKNSGGTNPVYSVDFSVGVGEVEPPKRPVEPGERPRRG